LADSAYAVGIIDNQEGFLGKGTVKRVHECANTLERSMVASHTKDAACDDDRPPA
jgi:hypothetical protein